MRLIKNMVAELVGLFVDDESLVLAMIAWVVVGAICLRAQWLDPAPASILLALGIAVLLVENVLRYARVHALSSPRTK